MRLEHNDRIRTARDNAAREVIVDELRRGGNVATAAAALGLTRETLQRWITRLGIDVWEATGRERPKGAQNVTGR